MVSRLSDEYSDIQSEIWRIRFIDSVISPVFHTPLSAGRSRPSKTTIRPTTTSSSVTVKAARWCGRFAVRPTRSVVARMADLLAPRDPTSSA